MMILNDLFFILQWLIIFEVTEKIGNYGFSEVMLLWAISAGSYGIAHTFFEGAFRIKRTYQKMKICSFFYLIKFYKDKNCCYT